jgi:hypothetical protein
MCSEFLELVQMEETFGFARVVTGDESWLYLNHSHTHMWSMADDEGSVRLGQKNASEKHMFMVILPIKAILVIEWMDRVINPRQLPSEM